MFYLYIICCAAIRRNKEWMNEWIVTHGAWLDWIYVATTVLWTVCLSVWCMLQLNGDKTELLWFSSATHLQWLDPSRWTTVSSSQWPSFVIWACGSTQSCLYANIVFPPAPSTPMLIDNSPRCVCTTRLGPPGLLQRCSCRSSSGNTGTTAESITSYLDAVLLDCCFPTRCVTQV